MPDHQIDYKQHSKKIYEFEIEIEFIHHLKEFYRRIHRYLNQENYHDVNGKTKFEQLYWQRDRPDGLQEHHLWWRAWKYPGYEIHRTKQFIWYIRMTARTLYTKRVEVMHKGKKWKIWMSNPTFNFRGYLIFEYQKEFQKLPLLKQISQRWEKWIYKDRWKYFEDDFIKEMAEFQDILKAFLQLKQADEVPPNIHPPNAQP